MHKSGDLAVGLEVVAYEAFAFHRTKFVDGHIAAGEDILVERLVDLVVVQVDFLADGRSGADRVGGMTPVAAPLVGSADGA